MKYTPASSLTLCPAHIWYVSQCAQQWCPAAAECTSCRSIALLSTGYLPLGYISTLCPLYARPYYPQSVWPSDGGSLPALLTLLPQPPRPRFCRVIPSVPPLYRASPNPTPSLPSLSTPSPPYPTNAMCSRGSGTGPPSCCC